MEPENFGAISINDICRLCSVKPKTDVILSTVSSSSFNPIAYAEIIEMVSPKIYFENDKFEFPNGICDECSEKLINFYKFKLLIEYSQIHIESLLSKNENAEILENTVEEFLDSNLSSNSSYYENIEKLDYLDYDSVPGIEPSVIRPRCFPEDTKILPPEEQEIWKKKLNSWIRKQQDTEENHHHDIIPKPYICDICGKSYASTFSLKDHLVVHTGELNFQCNECGKKFALKKILNLHIRTKHTNCEMYYCDICGYGFNRRSNLKTHKWVHKDVKRYACDLCGKTFKWRNGLSIHLNMHHGGGKKYSCYLCDKVYSSSSSRGKHCRLVHGGLGTRPIVANDEI